MGEGDGGTNVRTIINRQRMTEKRATELVRHAERKADVIVWRDGQFIYATELERKKHLAG